MRISASAELTLSDGTIARLPANGVPTVSFTVPSSAAGIIRAITFSISITLRSVTSSRVPIGAR